MKKTIRNAALMLCIAAPFAQAESTGAMFSSLNNFNAPDSDAVTGVRLAALHGKTGDIKGVDFSLIGMSESDSITGVNFPLIIGANRVHGEMTGASFGIFNWHEGQDVGANLGAVNITQDVTGANVSFVNIAKGNTTVDIGAVNLSNDSMVQVGIFNKTAEIKGVQVGLINCASNGFLPCFPIVNFAVK